MQPKPETIFLCTVSHNGQIDARMAGIFYSMASRERFMNIHHQQTSLLASGLNKLWCKALNDREQYGYKWFALLHADIVPERFFLDKLIEQAEAFDADVMSAVVPIKGPDGVTSTALSGPDEFTRLTRLTVSQVYDPEWPMTFDAWGTLSALKKKGLSIDDKAAANCKLLVNTGCMITRIDREWCAHVEFTINDRIITLAGGKLLEQVEPEDWYFSLRVAQLGGKVMATKAVKLEHVGTMSYHSHTVWGKEIDPGSSSI
jgi:hypothetical protein